VRADGAQATLLAAQPRTPVMEPSKTPGGSTSIPEMEPTEVNANRSARLPGGQISLDDSA
jgi:hypothetical protein